MSDIDDARASKRLYADKAIERFYDQYKSDVSRWKLEPADQKFLTLITTKKINSRALLSNRHVRRAAQDAMIDAFLDHYGAQPEQKRYFITLMGDLGVTWERQPKIDLVALKNIGQSHLRRAGLDGVGTVEIDTWKNLTGEPGRRVVPHFHFMGWPVDPAAFNHKALEAKLCASLALSNSLGAPGAFITPIRSAAADMAHIGMYLLKAPAEAKNMVPHSHGNVLRSAPHAAGSVARLVEIFSRVEVCDLLFSIGDGKKIAASVRSAVKASIATPLIRDAPSREDVVRHWRRIRLVNNGMNFQEPTVVTRASDRTEESE